MKKDEKQVTKKKVNCQYESNKSYLPINYHKTTADRLLAHHL